MESSSSNRPNFVMIFLPEISVTKVKIPPHVSIVLPKNVTLRDKYNNNWQVRARKVGGHWYFMDGWAKFIEDNSVARMDVLVFDYSGPGLFDVKINGSDGDVKEGVGYSMVDNTQEHQNRETEFEDESEDDDTLEVVPSGKNKKVGYYNVVKAKGKKGKEVVEYQDDDDTWEVVPSGKNKYIGYYNSVKAKGKKGKQVAKYQDDDYDEYVSDHDSSHDRGHGYWDDEGEDENEDSDAFELVYRKTNKGKEVVKELKKARDDNNASGSRKPQQKKRNVDCLGIGTLKAGLPSKRAKSSYYVRRMKPSLMNELNRGERIWNAVSEEDEEEEEEDTEDESSELIRRHDKKGKGRAMKEPRAYVGAYTATDSGNPHQKRRKVDDFRGKKIITSRSAPSPKNPSSAAKMPPLRINEPDNRGKGISSESSDEVSDYLGYKDISPDEFRPKQVKKGLDDATKLKSKVGDAEATTSKKPHRKRVNVDWLGKKNFESGLAPKPQCTYFVTTMKPKRMNELYIPKDLLMDENLYLPKKMKLVDPRGRTYTARLVSWTDGRTFYKGGWNRLCRRNDIRKEDYCICEFGDGAESGHLFISIARANRAN